LAGWRSDGASVTVTRVSKRGNHYPDAISVFTRIRGVSEVDALVGRVEEETLSLVRRADGWGKEIPFTEVQVFDGKLKDTYTYINNEWYRQRFAWTRAELLQKFISPGDIAKLYAPPEEIPCPRLRR
jgi:hypothetical protein